MTEPPASTELPAWLMHVLRALFVGGLCLALYLTWGELGGMILYGGGLLAILKTGGSKP